MHVKSDLAEAIGNTPLIRLNKVSEATGCEILGKCRIPQSRPVGEGSRRALHHPRRGRARAAEARRHHRRGHRRQHRHRPRAGGRLDGVQDRHRDPRDAEPGKEGHDPPGRRRAGASPGGALQKSEQLREVFRAVWPPRWPRPSPRARSGPTSSTTPPTASPMPRPRAPRSGTRPTAASTASSAPWARAARWPASPTRCSRRA